MGLRSMLGVGGAKVDTQLQGNGAPGHPLPGQVVISGGKRPQDFRRIYVSLETSYRHDDETHTVSLAKQDVSGPISVQPGQEIVLPLQFVLPPDTPLTYGRSPGVRLRTGLDVEGAIDPKDSDPVNVVPNEIQSAVFAAAEQMGLRLHDARHEHNPRSPHRFFQEIVLKPFGGPFAGRVDDVEMIFRPAADGYDVFLEVDQRRRGVRGIFAEITNLDERRTGVHVGFGEASSGAVLDLLGSTIAAQL